MSTEMKWYVAVSVFLIILSSVASLIQGTVPEEVTPVGDNILIAWVVLTFAWGISGLSRSDMW